MEGAVVRDGRALEGTDALVSLSGPATKSIVLAGNDVRRARALVLRAPDLAGDPVIETGTIRKQK